MLYRPRYCTMPPRYGAAVSQLARIAVFRQVGHSQGFTTPRHQSAWCLAWRESRPPDQCLIRAWRGSQAVAVVAQDHSRLMTHRAELVPGPQQLTAAYYDVKVS